MTLFDRITKILFEESLGVNEFLEKTKFSKGLYYDIRSGKKKRLRPEQAKRINKAFPEYTFEWLNDVSEKVNYSSVNEKGADYKVSDAVLKAQKKGFGIYLVDHHQRLLKEDISYKMWFEKENALAAIELVKELVSKK